MLKKLLLATTVCIALSACNDSSSSSSTEPSDSLATLSFEDLSNVSSIARVETSSEDGSHLIGFDANGASIGDISNINVDKFTPVTGGFIVEVTKKHKANYLYKQSIAPVDGINSPEDITASVIAEALITGEKSEVTVNQTMRKPVWYYVTTSGDYYLIIEDNDLPNFMGENSEGKLVFSDGLLFDVNEHLPSYFYNNIALDKKSIIDAINQATSDNPTESIKEVLKNLLDNNTIERAKDFTLMSGDSLLSNSKSLGKVLIDSKEPDISSLPFLPAIPNVPQIDCSQFKPAKRPTCAAVNLTVNNKLNPIIDNINDGTTIINGEIIPVINSKVIPLINAIGPVDKVTGEGATQVSQILPIPDSKMTLLNTGYLDQKENFIAEHSGGWNGESALTSSQAFLLSNSFDDKNCQDANKQCLYSLQKMETTTDGIIDKTGMTLEITPLLELSTGFEADSIPNQIEGGQQNYLWVNDSYIVIKEATQISIIDRADNNKLLDPVLAGTEIDTINLTDDNKLYITATDSSNTPAAYIYDIATKTGLDAPISNEKLHALKALIK